MSTSSKHDVGSALYERVAGRLRQRLAVREPGELIEPERVLVDELGVSRVTLRRAIDLLVDEQLLVRRQGVGTFVAAPKVTHPLGGLHSTRDVAAADGLVLTSEILRHTIGPARADERVRLGLGRGARVLRFVRRDRAAGRALAIAACALPAELASGLTADALAEHSTYELLERHHSVRVVRARQALRAEPASAHTARLLGVARGRPLLVLDRVTVDASGRALESAIVSYPHDRAECVVELTREGWREAPTGLAIHYTDRRRSR
jgi:GntR family transcriptional regulator